MFHVDICLFVYYSHSCKFTQLELQIIILTSSSNDTPLISAATPSTSVTPYQLWAVDRHSRQRDLQGLKEWTCHTLKLNHYAVNLAFIDISGINYFLLH